MRIDVRQVTFAFEYRFDIAFFFCDADTLVHVIADTRIAFEITFYKLFGFCPGNVQPFGKSEYGDAVDDPEIGRFCLAAHVAGHFLYRDAVYLGGGCGVDIGAAAEGFDHVLVLAQMGHDAEFDLRVVRREEGAIFVVGNECFTDLTSQFVADRDILEIRIRRTQAAGSRDGLVERGVDLACFRINQFGKGIYIGTQQFFQSAIFQQLAYHRVFGTHFFQNIFARTVTACFCLFGFLFDLEMFEKDFAHLFAGIDIEFDSCQFVNLFFQIVECGGQFFR